MRPLLFCVLIGCSQTPASPDAGMIDSGVVPSTPESIFGSLELWLDGDDAMTIAREGGLVTTWTDKAKKKPFTAFGGAGTADATLANGHGAVRVGAGYGVYRGDGPPFSSQALVAVVAEFSNPPTDPGILFSDGPLVVGVNPAMTTRATGGIGMLGTGAMTSSDGWNDGAYHTFGFFVDYAAGKSWVRVDGKESSGPGYTMEVSAGSPAVIGGNACTTCNPPVDTLVHGHIAEVIVATKVTSQELAGLSAYFTKKYGLAF